MEAFDVLTIPCRGIKDNEDTISLTYTPTGDFVLKIGSQEDNVFYFDMKYSGMHLINFMKTLIDNSYLG